MLLLQNTRRAAVTATFVAVNTARTSSAKLVAAVPSVRRQSDRPPRSDPPEVVTTCTTSGPFAPLRRPTSLPHPARLSSHQRYYCCFRHFSGCRVPKPTNRYHPAVSFSSAAGPPPGEANADDGTIEIVVSVPDDHDLTIPGAQTGGRKLAIVYTCTVCNTRAAKQFTERAYHHGVVIVRCPGCQNQHLIADRLGYFQDGPFDLDTIAAKTGHVVKRITADGGAQITLEDLVGKDRLEEIVQAARKEPPSETSPPKK